MLYCPGAGKLSSTFEWNLGNLDQKNPMALGGEEA